jgi:hypothetical protein
MTSRLKTAGVRLGDLCARALLTAFYFTLLVPFGLASRFLHDPLGLRSGKTRSFWVKKRAVEPGLDHARKGY